MNTENSVVLPLAEVPAGARLTAAVLGADKQVLMTAGSILTSAALEKLSQRGVTEVSIEAPKDEAQLAATRAALEQRLRHLFRRCDLEHDEGARLLFKAVLDHRLETVQ